MTTISNHRRANVILSPTIILWSIFIALCAVKIIFVSIPTVGPVIFGDELLYKQFAFKLFNFDTYGSGQYPLLYPAFLAPSFLFGENFYEAMKISNSVVSSLMIIPVFLISRLFLSEKESLLVVLSAAVAPYHYVFPQLLMSENLFLPLMLAGVYIAIRKPDRNLLAWDIATGIITGLLYLTRHISLVIIIALALTWLITNYERSWRVWLRCAIILAVASATYSPWILIQIHEGTTFKNIFGFNIINNKSYCWTAY